MLAVQKALRENGLDKTVEQYGLRVNRDLNLYQFSYFVDSPRGDRVSDDCRGLILDAVNNWNVVAMSFRRFYNHGEVFARDDIDYANASVQEKLDGSMMMLYWHPYRKEWTVATRGSVLASGNVGRLEKTFSELFWETLEQYPTNVNQLDRSMTYIFELTGPENRVVTPYLRNELHLIGIRNVVNGMEQSREKMKFWSDVMGIPMPKEYRIDSFVELNELMSNCKPTDEGYVVVEYTGDEDVDFPRVKVKNPSYLHIHTLLGNGNITNSKRFWELVRNDDCEEFVSYFPEYRQPFEEGTARLNAFVAALREELNALGDIRHDKKEFAIAVKDRPWAGVLFAVNNGKAEGVSDALQEVRVEALIEMMESFDEQNTQTITYGDSKESKGA